MAQTGNTKNTPQGEAASEESQERPETPAAGDDPLRKFRALSGDWFWVQDAQLRLTYMSSRLGESSGIDLALYLGARRWEQPALNLSQADWDQHRALVERVLGAHAFPEPDATLWLRVPIAVAVERMGSAASERFERADFLARVDAEYERLGLELIDASGSPEQVQAELRRRVAAILGDPTCR